METGHPSQCWCFKNKKEADIDGARCPYHQKPDSQFCGIHKKCPRKYGAGSPKKLGASSPRKKTPSPRKKTPSPRRKTPSPPRPAPYAVPDRNGIIFREGLALLKHQKLALKWMSDLGDIRQKFGLKGGILQLDMGLGKTLIALYWTLLRRRDYDTPFLVVCDKSLITNWLNEADKFFGRHIKIFVFYSGYHDLAAVTRADFAKADVVLTTYNTVKIAAKDYIKDIKRGSEIINANYTDEPRSKGMDALILTRWAGVFADEAQAFSNPRTVAFKSMMRLSADEGWCLTGTPIRNSDVDMYSLMRFCGMDVITSPSRWDYEFYSGRRLSRFVKSMDYAQAGIKLPDIVERNYIVDLEGKQLELYKYYEQVMWQIMGIYARKRREAQLAAPGASHGAPIVDVRGIQVNFVMILAIFTRLRQICIIPRIAWLNANVDNLVNRVIYALPAPMADWIKDPDSSAYHKAVKLQKATEIIRGILKNTREKILVFSSFKQVLDLYGDYLKREFPGTPIAQLDGSQTVSERARSIASFKEGGARIFLITFKTGAQGLTLIEANHVIPIEPWWSPTIYDQAIARAHRIGQTKTVTVYNILARDTIETRIMKICSQKQTLIQKFLGQEGEEVALKLDFKGLCRLMVD